MPRKALEPIFSEAQRTELREAAQSGNFDFVREYQGPKHMGMLEFAETSGLHYSTIRNYAANRLLGAKIAGIFYIDWREALVAIYSGQLAEKSQDLRKAQNV